MKKYFFLLIALLIFAPVSVLAVTDLSQQDFDMAKMKGEYKGLAYSNEYNNYWFKTDGEYRLITDVTLTNQIVSNEADPELIIDLNGKTLSYNTTENDMTWFITIYTSKFTIKGKGNITSNSKMKYILIGTEGSDITLDGCTIEGRIGLDGKEKPEELTIKSGNFGSLSAVKANITIDDANFNSNFLERETLCVNEDVNLIINGGTFESNYGALKSLSSPDKHDTTSITINDGTFKGKEKYGLVLSGHEKLTINGGVFKDDTDTLTITKGNQESLQKIISTCKINGTIKVTKGENSKYKVGVDNDLSITIDKEYEVFVYEDVIYGSVYVDNKKLDETDFSMIGNTTITLKKEYLDTLSVGNHSLIVLSGYGDFASTSFYIVESSSIVLYFAIIGGCVVVIAGFAIYFINKKKKR